MALFRGKSLVDSVDEIINLVKTWNVMHCAPSHRSNSKKRAAPSSSIDDHSMTATPAKKNKRNSISTNLNCLINLENETRTKLCKLAIEGITSIHNVSFTDEKEEHEYLYNVLSRPRHGRGEITLPCFKLCKLLNIKNAHQIATDLCAFISLAIEKNSGVLFLSNPFLKVEAANGRINAYLKASYIGQIIPLILNKHNSFLSRLPSNRERVMVEYSQPNTHKAFHVGHMRNVALGDCIIRLYQHCGYTTVAVNYFGDEGAHVAKCIWLLQKEIDENKLDLETIESDDSINKGEWLGNKYAEAVKLLSLSTYTAFPFIGVIVGKILTKEKHKNHDKWHVVTVEYATNPSKIATVVCGGTHYNIGNLIAYTPVGCKYKDKIAEKKDMKGVMSEGVIMGALELGVKLPSLIKSKEEKEQKEQSKKSKKKKKKQRVKDQRIYLVDDFYADSEIGDKLIQVGKFDDYSDCKDVCELWSERVCEQANVLKLLESGDEKYVSLWQQTRRWSLDEFGKIYKWLGARFDHDFFESECSEESRQLVDEYYNKGIFVKSEGAIGCNLSDNLGFCMLLKSNGCGLYATKDLTLAKKKFEQFKIDQSIYVVDSTQERHFKQVFATLNCMGYKQSEKCYHLSYAFVRLPSGKMSTRTGNVILFSDLVKLLATQINKLFLNDKKDWEAKELLEAERAISVGTIRYGMLNHDNNKEIVFDLAKWTLSSGNTGPYLMYQYARIASISRKVEFPDGIDINNLDYSVLNNESEITKTILFELSHFQSKITEITINKSPSQLCDYLYSICKLFSQWYCIKDNSIMHCEDKHLKAVRLQFCDAVAKTIKVGIQLLGITPLERM